ncbi:MAG: sigma-70 factor domain-containing protein, partial [Pseudomonadota bacterium]
MSGGEGVAAQGIGLSELLETDEAKGLLDAAERAGSLSAEEIAVALGDLEVDAGTVDDFYRTLDEMHIDVVGRAVEEEEPVAVAREVSTDALQLFLKDIGKVELLTAAQEVEL